MTSLLHLELATARVFEGRQRREGVAFLMREPTLGEIKCLESQRNLPCDDASSEDPMDHSNTFCE
jgi:hypothetical protein